MKRNNTNSYRIVGILEIIVGLILLMKRYSFSLAFFWLYKGLELK